MIPIEGYVGKTAIINEPKHINDTDSMSALRRPR